MADKHTPGPWSLGSTGWYVQHDEAYEQTSQGVVGSNGTPICEVVSIEYDDTEIDANARLIAAAPELLEALKDARFALYGSGPGNPKIDAAIAKAEGRS